MWAAKKKKECSYQSNLNQQTKNDFRGVAIQNQIEYHYNDRLDSYLPWHRDMVFSAQRRSGVPLSGAKFLSGIPLLPPLASINPATCIVISKLVVDTAAAAIPLL